MKNKEKDVAFGNRLAFLRNKTGMKQTDVAKAVGVGYKSLQNHEAGQWPARKNLLKYIDFYGCDEAWLITGNGGPFPSKPPLYNKVGVIEPRHVAQPGPEYQKHGGWKPQTDAKDWEMVGKALTILSSGTIFSQALAANIHAFFHALDLDQTVKDQAGRIDALEKECAGLKDRLAALEERLKDFNPPAIEDQGWKKSAAT